MEDAKDENKLKNTKNQILKITSNLHIAAFPLINPPVSFLPPSIPSFLSFLPCFLLIIFLSLCCYFEITYYSYIKIIHIKQVYMVRFSHVTKSSFKNFLKVWIILHYKNIYIYSENIYIYIHNVFIGSSTEVISNLFFSWKGQLPWGQGRVLL